MKNNFRDEEQKSSDAVNSLLSDRMSTDTSWQGVSWYKRLWILFLFYLVMRFNSQSDGVNAQTIPNDQVDNFPQTLTVSSDPNINEEKSFRAPIESGRRSIDMNVPDVCETLHELHAQGWYLDNPGKNHLTILHELVRLNKDDLSAIACILEMGADAEATINEIPATKAPNGIYVTSSMTPLMDAVKLNKVYLVKLLLAYDANPLVVCDGINLIQQMFIDCETPIYSAIEGHLKTKGLYNIVAESAELIANEKIATQIFAKHKQGEKKHEQLKLAVNYYDSAIASNFFVEEPAYFYHLMTDNLNYPEYYDPQRAYTLMERLRIMAGNSSYAAKLPQLSIMDRLGNEPSWKNKLAWALASLPVLAIIVWVALKKYLVPKNESQIQDKVNKLNQWLDGVIKLKQVQGLMLIQWINYNKVTNLNFHNTIKLPLLSKIQKFSAGYITVTNEVIHEQALGFVDSFSKNYDDITKQKFEKRLDKFKKTIIKESLEYAYVELKLQIKRLKVELIKHHESKFIEYRDELANLFKLRQELDFILRNILDEDERIISIRTRGQTLIQDSKTWDSAGGQFKSDVENITMNFNATHKSIENFQILFNNLTQDKLNEESLQSYSQIKLNLEKELKTFLALFESLISLVRGKSIHLKSTMQKLEKIQRHQQGRGSKIENEAVQAYHQAKLQKAKEYAAQLERINVIKQEQQQLQGEHQCQLIQWRARKLAQRNIELKAQEQIETLTDPEPPTSPKFFKPRVRYKAKNKNPAEVITALNQLEAKNKVFEPGNSSLNQFLCGYQIRCILIKLCECARPWDGNDRGFRRLKNNLQHKGYLINHARLETLIQWFLDNKAGIKENLEKKPIPHNVLTLFSDNVLRSTIFKKLNIQCNDQQLFDSKLTELKDSLSLLTQLDQIQLAEYTSALHMLVAIVSECVRSINALCESPEVAFEAQTFVLQIRTSHSEVRDFLGICDHIRIAISHGTHANLEADINQRFENKYAWFLNHSGEFASNLLELIYPLDTIADLIHPTRLGIQ